MIEDFSSKKQYKIGQVIGSGSFSIVYAGVDTSNNEAVCIKRIQKLDCVTTQAMFQLRKEISNLSRCDHPSIVKLICFIEDSEFYNIVMELCSGITLLKMLKAKKVIENSLCKQIYWQIISALAYLHEIGICHRDIKLENIIISPNNDIKIIDFGFSSLTEPGKMLKTVCGSSYYVSPETLNGKSYDGFSSDIWASGVLLFAMATGKIPWKESKNQMVITKQIINCQYEVPTDIDLLCSDLISKILVADPASRPTAKQILNHTFLNGCAEQHEMNNPRIAFNLGSPDRPNHIRRWQSDHSTSEQLNINMKAHRSQTFKVGDQVHFSQEEFCNIFDRIGVKKRRRSSAIHPNPEKEVLSNLTFGTCLSEELNRIQISPKNV